MQKWSILAVLTGLLAACSTPSQPLVLAQPVDLARFAGDWYVIASIPTILEAGANDAKETYLLKPNGTMDTTFSFHAKSADGPLRTYRSIGYPQGPSNVVWGQHYLWPIDVVLPLDADYRIAYLSPDYSQVVIGRESRDHVWIMARTPTISDADYQGLLNFTGRVGYDVNQVKRVPQSGAR